MIDPETAQALQDAMAGYLQDGDLVVGWLLTLEIASADGGHYLAHRHGGGLTEGTLRRTGR